VGTAEEACGKFRGGQDGVDRQPGKGCAQAAL
jgi:hypothetical protein